MSEHFVRENLTRAAAVRALGILDTDQEERFDRLTFCQFHLKTRLDI